MITSKNKYKRERKKKGGGGGARVQQTLKYDAKGQRKKSMLTLEKECVALFVTIRTNREIKMW